MTRAAVTRLLFHSVLLIDSRDGDTVQLMGPDQTFKKRTKPWELKEVNDFLQEALSLLMDYFKKQKNIASMKSELS